ncbi:MAG: hypothetical protein A2504_12175 [Bdellovibrionales bacterium RIFOXYD12_FULL_39_22]|nr:MAG: hypothetical protein A2504_12175 [Bdellovibrionales bacterium RIFOXYD12_FULL_39_22]
MSPDSPEDSLNGTSPVLTKVFSGTLSGDKAVVADTFTEFEENGYLPITPTMSVVPNDSSLNKNEMVPTILLAKSTVIKND